MLEKRLAKLESVLSRPAEAAPVDMRPFHRQLDFLLAGSAHKGRNSLERFAAALGVSVARLWKLVATPGRKRFAALCGRLSRLLRTTSDDVAVEVRQEFIRDELRHRLRGLGAPIEGPLCRVRPLQGV